MQINLKCTKCKNTLNPERGEFYRCPKCQALFKREVSIEITTIEVEAENEAEALSKAWGVMENALDIIDMRAVIRNDSNH